jgi:hypothetical protein
MDGKRPSSAGEGKWLMLMHQLPARPAYLRVKIWRRLQAVGAISLKNSVYALPDRPASREEFHRLSREIEQGGGDAMICEAGIVAGMQDEQIRAVFNAARSADYATLAREMRQLMQSIRRSKKLKPEAAPVLVKFRQRLSELSAIDFFDAPGRSVVEALLSELEHSSIFKEEPLKKPLRLARSQMIGKTWVTREDIHVDRIACAWLIRRFIDPGATFKFVPPKPYETLSGEFRYDMHDAEFTHEGDKCSFEVLLERTGIKDPALRAIGEIIHDLDLSDSKFARPETPGIGHVVSGICRTQALDEARMARGGELFDHTYEQFRRRGR